MTSYYDFMDEGLYKKHREKIKKAGGKSLLKGIFEKGFIWSLPIVFAITMFFNTTNYFKNSPKTLPQRNVIYKVKQASEIIIERNIQIQETRNLILFKPQEFSSKRKELKSEKIKYNQGKFIQSKAKPKPDLELAVLEEDKKDIYYTTKKRDNLTKIVQKHHGYLGYHMEDSFTTYIADINGINKNEISVGEKIVIPSVEEFMQNTGYDSSSRIIAMKHKDRVYINHTNTKEKKSYTLEIQGSKEKAIEFEKGRVDLKAFKQRSGVAVIRDESRKIVSSFRISQNEEPTLTDEYFAKRYEHTIINAGNVGWLFNKYDRMNYVEANLHKSNKELEEDLGYSVLASTIKTYRKFLQTEKEKQGRAQVIASRKSRSNYFVNQMIHPRKC